MQVKDHDRASSLEAAFEKIAANPQNALLAGGLWIKKTGAPIDTLIDLEGLGLDKIEETPEEIIIGAMTPLRVLEINPSITMIGGGFLSQAIGSVMGVSLRRLATIGGSVAGKYPFSDVITALLALDITLDFYPERHVSLQDFLFEKGRVKTILTHIRIRKTDCKGYFHKVSNTPLDFAILNIAITKMGTSYRIVVGSRPGVAALAHEAMTMLAGKKHLSEGDCDAAATKAVADLSFLDTSAASAEYRRTLAYTYVKRGLAEVTKP